MGLILWVLFGALIGWLASLLMRTDASQGPVLNIVVGVLGAIIGGLVMSQFGYGGVSGFNLYSILVALLGAVVLIGFAKLVSTSP